MITSAKNPIATLQFDPLPKQKIFSYLVLESEIAKFVWYCGGFGSGKSYMGSQIATRLAVQAPMGRGLIARQTAVDLKATTMKTFWEVTDPRSIATHNKSESLITYKNGHEIYYWGLDDIEKLKSLELGWYWIDEVNEVPEETFNVLKGRLRHKSQPKRVGFITSNSEGKNWTYKQFIKGKGLRRKEDLQKYFIIKAPSNENTHLPGDYLDTLNSYTGDLYERYVKASFEVFEGQIFPEIQHGVHIIKPFAIPKDWKKYRVIDHGERNPTACLWATVSDDGDVYFYREHYKANEYVPYHAKKIAELTGDERIEYTLIDPSVKSVRGHSGRKVDKEYKEELEDNDTNHRLKYANNDVNAGIARFHRYLRIDPERIHPITKAKGSPRVFFFSNLEHTLEELENYKWKKISPTSEDDPEEKPRKKDDHTCDCARYLIMDRPDILTTSVSQKDKQAGLSKLNQKQQDQLLTREAQYLANLKKQFPDDFK